MLCWGPVNYRFVIGVTAVLALGLLVAPSGSRHGGSFYVPGAKLAEPPAGTVRLFAPQERVPAGTPLSSLVLREVFWPIAQVPPGAVRDEKEFAGQFAAKDLAPWIPLQRWKLSAFPPPADFKRSPGMRTPPTAPLMRSPIPQRDFRAPNAGPPFSPGGLPGR